MKQSLDTAETTAHDDKKLPCIVRIDRWERETIENIREIAMKARTNMNEMMTKNVAEIRSQLEELSVKMQQQQKEGSYLENDVERVKWQLNQLKETIQHVNDKIRITTSNNIDWDSLIHVVLDKNSAADHTISSECFNEQDKIHNNF